MPALRTEFSKLLIYDPDRCRSTIHCFNSRPTPLEERAMGRLFLVVEIDGSNVQNQQLIEELQQVIAQEYYGSDHFQIEVAFERALQKTNEHLHGLIGDQLTEWLQGLNILIAVLKDTTLHFTVIGRMHAFLVHRQRIIDILDTSNGAPTETPTPLKIFTNVISGQLNLDDMLLFCTTSILDHLSQEKLKRLMIDQTPTDATRALDSLLSEADGAAGFGAYIIRLTPEIETATEELAPRENVRPITTTTPRDSMAQLIAREHATNTLLHHSMWPNVGRLAKSGAAYLRAATGRKGKEDDSTKQEPAAATPEQPQISPRRMTPKTTSLSSAGSVASTIFRGIGAALSAVFMGVIRGLVRVLTFFRRPSTRSSAHHLPYSANRGLSHGSKWFQNLTPGRRRLLLVAIVLILLFSQSIVSLGNSRESKKNTATYQNLLRVANEKVSAADAALLIKNESSARTSLKEAQDALAGIPNTKGAPKAEADALRKTIAAKLDSIRHVVTVDPESVVDLAGLDIGFAASSITNTTDTLFTFNTKNSSLYSVSLKDKKTSTVIDAPSLQTALVNFVTGDGPLALLQADGSLQTVNTKDGTLSGAPVQYENVDRNVVQASFYNSRLYTLDIRNNQVFRHDKSGSGYGLGQSWIKETGVDIRDGVSFAIDGTVYVLKGNGQVLKFSSGKKANTNFDAVDPAMTKPKRLTTNAATTSVFILDPSEHRVVEFGKDGAFLRQYQADVLANAVDLTVNNGTIYILTPTQILSFPVSTEKSST